MKGLKFCACIFRLIFLNTVSWEKKFQAVSVMRISINPVSVQFCELRFEIIIIRFFQILETVRKLEFSACSSTSLNHLVSSMKAKSMLTIKY